MATAQEVKDAIDRAIAGVKTHYDAQIAVLKNEITTLKATGAASTLTAKDIVDAIGSARISTSTNNILVPKFDAMKTTPMEFINEVERYFKLQNYQAGD
jgi:phage host-nuclease inhibitor protein Gam